MTAPQTPGSLIPKPPPVAKSVIAVCAGLFVGGLMIVALERLGHLVAIPPVSDNPTDPVSVRAAMSRMTATNFLLLLVAYFCGSTIGCWIAARMSPSQALRHALVVAALFVFTISSYFTKVPHPAWFVAASVLAFIAAPFLGARMSGKR